MNRKQRRAQKADGAGPGERSPHNLQTVFSTALERHQSGRLADAERLYRQVLAVDPRHADSLHLLGVVAHQTGRGALAVELIEKAIGINGGVASYQSNLGLALRQAGRFDEAVASFKRAVSLKPDYAEAHNNLGTAYSALGRFDDAAGCFRRAIELRAGYAEAFFNLGNALKRLDRLDDAIAAYRGAVAAKPDFVEAHSNLGLAQQDRLLAADAAASFRRAVELRPGSSELHFNLGTALTTLRRPDQAILSYRKAISLDPGNADAYGNLGVALQEQGLGDEAFECFQRAAALKPQDSEALNNYGNALQEQGRLDQAIECYRRALDGKPDHAEAHNNLAVALLLKGDFAPGWEEFEWRWRIPSCWGDKRRDYPRPLWSGESAQGGTMLLWAEQGAGDTLQFGRYVAQVVRLGWRVILEVPESLMRLFASIKDVELIAKGTPSPDFDVHCPLMSLPRIFGTNRETIPAGASYFDPPPALVEAWRTRLAAVDGVKIGIVWRGNPAYKRNRQRSMPASFLTELIDRPGLFAVSLQMDATDEELAGLTRNREILNAAPQLGDYADTAALIANLDLVVSVDTSVCHLAGALGRPVWTLLDFAADWRWLRQRTDSPWYPGMRLFRQPSPGDWTGVIAAATSELTDIIPANP